MTTLLSVIWKYIKISHFRSIEAYHSVFPFLYPPPPHPRPWKVSGHLLITWFELQHSAVSSSWQISIYVTTNPYRLKFLDVDVDNQRLVSLS